MSTASQKRFSFEDYLAWEERRLEKHMFYSGEVFATAGSTFDHGKIIANLHHSIGNQSSISGCGSVGPDLKVSCQTGLCTYPDVVVYCDKPEFAESKKLVIKNPEKCFRGAISFDDVL